MKFDRFTIKAQEAVQQSQSAIGLALGPSRDSTGCTCSRRSCRPGGRDRRAPILQRLGADPRAVAAAVEERLAAWPASVEGAVGPTHPSQLAGVGCSTTAEKIAKRIQVTTTSRPNTCCWRWPAARTRSTEILGKFRRHRAGHPCRAARSAGKRHGLPIANPEEKFQALERYARDLTEMARLRKLDPLVGSRRRELERAVQILCRRTKNNAGPDR